MLQSVASWSIFCCIASIHSLKRNAILFSEDREQAAKRLMELKCADEQKQASKMQGELASAEKRLVELDVKLKRTYEDVCCKG